MNSSEAHEDMEKENNKKIRFKNLKQQSHIKISIFKK